MRIGLRRPSDTETTRAARPATDRPLVVFEDNLWSFARYRLFELERA